MILSLPFIIANWRTLLVYLFEIIVMILTYTVGPIVVWLELLFHRIPKSVWNAFHKTEKPWKTIWDESLSFIRKTKRAGFLSLYIIGFVVLMWLSCSHLFDIRDIDTPYTETEMWINEHGFDAYYRFMEGLIYLNLDEQVIFARQHPKFTKYVYVPLFCTNRTERRRVRAYILKKIHNKNIYFENITFDSFGTEAKRLLHYAIGGTDSLYTQPYATYQAGLTVTSQELVEIAEENKKKK